MNHYVFYFRIPTGFLTAFKERWNDLKLFKVPLAKPPEQEGSSGLFALKVVYVSNFSASLPLSPTHMHQRMGRWMYRWLGGRMDVGRQAGRQTGILTDGGVDEQTKGWMDRLTERWTNWQMICTSFHPHIPTVISLMHREDDWVGGRMYRRAGCIVFHTHLSLLSCLVFLFIVSQAATVSV